MGNKKRLIIGLTILAVIIATSTLLHVEFITPASAEIDISLNIFIADLPNWASFANNVMFDSTKVWEDANPGLKFNTVQSINQANFKVQWVKEFGTENVGWAFGNKFIEVGLGDSNCGKTWHPYSLFKAVGNIIDLGS